MTRFKLYREETFWVPYTVEADNEHDAIEKCKRGDVESDGLDWAECIRTGEFTVYTMRTVDEVNELIHGEEKCED